MNIQLFESVKLVINQTDPLGLIKMGAPEDEYEPEIEDVVSKMSNGVRFNPQSVSSLFEMWSYPGCITEDCAEVIAKKLQTITVA